MKRLFRALFAVAALAWAPAVFAENVTEQKILKHMNEIEVFEMMTESALFVTEGQTGEKDRHAYFLYMSPREELRGPPRSECGRSLPFWTARPERESTAGNTENMTVRSFGHGR